MLITIAGLVPAFKCTYVPVYSVPSQPMALWCTQSKVKRGRLINKRPILRLIIKGFWFRKMLKKIRQKSVASQAG
jgi:hypothetical protein